MKEFIKAPGGGTFNVELVIANIANGYFNEIVETAIGIRKEHRNSFYHTLHLPRAPSRAAALPKSEMRRMLSFTGILTGTAHQQSNCETQIFAELNNSKIGTLRLRGKSGSDCRTAKTLSQMRRSFVQ